MPESTRWRPQGVAEAGLDELVPPARAARGVGDAAARRCDRSHIAQLAQQAVAGRPGDRRRQQPPPRRRARARELAARSIDYLDIGTSGGVWGLERGYC